MPFGHPHTGSEQMKEALIPLGEGGRYLRNAQIPDRAEGWIAVASVKF